MTIAPSSTNCSTKPVLEPEGYGVPCAAKALALCPFNGSPLVQ